MFRGKTTADHCGHTCHPSDLVAIEGDTAHPDPLKEAHPISSFIGIKTRFLEAGYVIGGEDGSSVLYCLLLPLHPNDVVCISGETTNVGSGCSTRRGERDSLPHGVGVDPNKRRV